jgi:hypothetical protein
MEGGMMMMGSWFHFRALGRSMLAVRRSMFRILDFENVCNVDDGWQVDRVVVRKMIMTMIIRMKNLSMVHLLPYRR